MNRRKVRLGVLGVVAALALVATLAQIEASLASGTAHPVACRELVVNGGFEDGRTAWVEHSKLQMELLDPFYPHTGKVGAWLGGSNDAEDWLIQTVALSPDATGITLRYWWAIFSEEPPGAAFDTARSELLRANGSVITTTLVIDNEAAEAWAWRKAEADLSAYAGQTVQLRLRANNDATNPTSFFFDDVSIVACQDDSTATPTPTPSVAVTPQARNGLFLPVVLR